MARFALVGKHGTDDPTLAGFPFIMGNAAAEQGHEVQICLLGEAVMLMKDSVAEATCPVGHGPIKGLLETAIGNGIPIYL